MAEDTVSFDILLNPPAGGGGPADVSTLDALRPPREDIVRCRRWLEGQQVTAHATDFGLSCQATPGRFEALFGVTLTPSAGGPGKPPFEMSGEPKAPPEIAELVDQVTIAARPEFF